jgi:HTH-type transcriptional regulator, cell division transcriptional repressor
MHDEKKNIVGGKVRLARLRGKTAITQQDLSARLAVMGISMDRTAISKMEAGRRLVTDFELYALSKALNVSIDWLCEHEHEPEYPKGNQSKKV